VIYINKIILVGHLTKDPILTFAAGTGTAICKFTIAVNRRFKREGQPTADFLQVIQFSKGGEATANYMTKGSLVSVSGSVQTGSYTNKDDIKVYTTDVLADEVNFLDSKGKREDNTSNNEDVTPIEVSDSEIPF